MAAPEAAQPADERPSDNARATGYRAGAGIAFLGEGEAVLTSGSALQAARTAQQVPLQEVAAELRYRAALFLRLDAFGHDSHV